MAGGGFKAPLFTVAWPTSEFGAMGLEGAVRLGMRRELDAIEDPEERERVFEATVASAYERGRGLNMAAYGEIDDVIDPADSRRWIATLFDEDDRAVVAAARQEAPLRRRLVSGAPVRLRRVRQLASNATPAPCLPRAIQATGPVILPRDLQPLRWAGGPDCSR